MAERLIQTIKDMADAIREKTRDTKKIKGEDIPQAIMNISSSLGDAAIFFNSMNDSDGIVDFTIYTKSGKIPTNIKVVGGSMNKICRLEGVKKLPDNFASFGSSNGIAAYAKTLYMDDSIEEFGTQAFFMSYITSFIFPDGTTNRIPKGVKEIPINCFSQSRITDLKLHDDIEVIGQSAFSNSMNYSKNMIGDAKLPNNLKYIDHLAFSNQNIAFTEMPEGVTFVGNNAFQNNETLTSLTFRGTPATIRELAFSGCKNLTTINVPWAEGAVANAPWGATNATINYNHTGG